MKSITKARDKKKRIKRGVKSRLQGLALNNMTREKSKSLERREKIKLIKE